MKNSNAHKYEARRKNHFPRQVGTLPKSLGASFPSSWPSTTVGVEESAEETRCLSDLSFVISIAGISIILSITGPYKIQTIDYGITKFYIKTASIEC